MFIALYCKKGLFLKCNNSPTKVLKTESYHCVSNKIESSQILYNFVFTVVPEPN